MVRSMRRRLAIAVVLAALLALPACGRADAGPSLPDRPEAPSGPSATAGSDSVESPPFPAEEGAEETTGSEEEDESQDEEEEEEGQGEDQSEAAASDDDLRVFAYATSDESALAAELTAMATTVAELESALSAADLDGAEAAARTLLEQAEALGSDAGAAEDRERPLDPADAEMVAARKDAIDAFGLTAEYATSVTDIANAVLAGQLAQLPALAQEAAELAGTSDDLTRAYTELNEELVAWAEANPADAARALAKYGEA